MYRVLKKEVSEGVSDELMSDLWRDVAAQVGVVLAPAHLVGELPQLVPRLSSRKLPREKISAQKI